MALFMLFTLAFSSCKTEGCTDPNSLSYNPDADKDDGSCTYLTPSGSIYGSIDLDSDPTFSFEIDGALTEYSGYPQYGMSGTSGLTGVISNLIRETGFYDDDLEYTIISINKGIHTFPTGDLTDADFLAYFASGHYSYAPLNSDDGIVIQVGKTTGEIYKSNLGSQTGATFEIIESEEDLTVGYNYVKTYCTFSCKLYNVDNPTDYITITNGKLVSHYGNF